MSQILNLLRPIQSGIEYVIVFLYNNIIPNYGVVIMILTIIVRLVVTAITISQTRSRQGCRGCSRKYRSFRRNIKTTGKKLRAGDNGVLQEENVNPAFRLPSAAVTAASIFRALSSLRTPSHIVTRCSWRPIYYQFICWQY